MTVTESVTVIRVCWHSCTLHVARFRPDQLRVSQSRLNPFFNGRNEMVLGDSETCRIVILGAARSRVARVYSLIQEDESSASCCGVSIQYLPCVATFDSYIDGGGAWVRFLSRVDYFPPGEPRASNGLLPFFDEESQTKDMLSDTKKLYFQGISGVAIGAGIENGEDVEMIGAFLETMSRRKVPIELVKPNPQFATLREEFEHYKASLPEEKEEMKKLGSMGPAKMARFTVNMAQRTVKSMMDSLELQSPKAAMEVEKQNERTMYESLDSEELIDSKKCRYACRKCRAIIFGQDHLEDPQHVPAKHKFSRRKHLTGLDASDCQSIFLHGKMSWMGDMDQEVGKLACPRCAVKIGTWHWSGAQCSCGTWVVPALQIPKSKVDTVSPQPHGHHPLALTSTSFGSVPLKTA